jgi:hypothetical protein
MKQLFFITLVLGISFSLNAQSFHGKKIKPNKKSTPAAMIETKMADKTEMKVRVTGVVENVCQAKGCWMKVTTAEGKTMRVTFKDYAFFVPKDIAGKTVTFEGKAMKSETSIDDLKHYAKDAGKTDAEISKITKSEFAINFEADGVIVN